MIEMREALHQIVVWYSPHHHIDLFLRMMLFRIQFERLALAICNTDSIPNDVCNEILDTYMFKQINEQQYYTYDRTLDSATINQTMKPKSGWRKLSSNTMIGNLRIKSAYDLSNNSMATRTAGRGCRRLMLFCKQLFKFDTYSLSRKTLDIRLYYA